MATPLALTAACGGFAARHPGERCAARLPHRAAKPVLGVRLQRGGHDAGGDWGAQPNFRRGCHGIVQPFRDWEFPAARLSARRAFHPSHKAESAIIIRITITVASTARGTERVRLMAFTQVP